MLPLEPDFNSLSHEELRSAVVRIWKLLHDIEFRYQELEVQHQQIQQENLELRNLVDSLRNENLSLQKENEELRTQLGKPKKDSSNSSLPPRTDQKPKIKPGFKLKAAATSPHHDGGRKLHPKPDHILVLKPSICQHCSHDISALDGIVRFRYDNYEIPEIKPVVTRVLRHQCKCPQCQKETLATCPVGFEQEMTLGPNLQSFLTYMRYDHFVSYERLSELALGIFNVHISEGTIANMFKYQLPKLKERHHQILEIIRNSDYINSDETGSQINKEKHYEWVFVSESACYHIIRKNRSASAISDIWTDAVLAVHRPLVWGSDLFTGQAKNPAIRWQICLSHQLRDCQYAIDCGESMFIPVIADVFREAIGIHRRWNQLKKSSQNQYRTRMNCELDRALLIVPNHPEGEQLQRRFIKNRDHLLVFLDDPKVEPTNNVAERALRSSVTFRKVTNVMRSSWGAEVFGAIRSIINTGAIYGFGALEAIRRALSPDSFLPT